jgi:hypothetical protein
MYPHIARVQASLALGGRTTSGTEAACPTCNAKARAECTPIPSKANAGDSVRYSTTSGPNPGTSLMAVITAVHPERTAKFRANHGHDDRNLVDVTMPPSVDLHALGPDGGTLREIPESALESAVTLTAEPPPAA